ncbi:MAG: polyphosphate kinase 1 [Coriobacteriales bacterium]|nr:polyphosphate kinase 1 [Coriobacteriales bacterium]
MQNKQNKDAKTASVSSKININQDYLANTEYMQNRELSWLDFDLRVLDQAADKNIPLLERLNFISIFASNLQEFFMVRVGRLTDLSLIKKDIIDKRSNMTPKQQLDAIYHKCKGLYTTQENIFKDLLKALKNNHIEQLSPSQLSEQNQNYLKQYMSDNVIPFLSPQIINAQHPFPHLNSGSIYVVVRLFENQVSNSNNKLKNTISANNTVLGLIPMPSQASRIIPIPSKNSKEFRFVLLEDAIEFVARDVFSMYKVKHTNIICVTRNFDLDVNEGVDESDEDYRGFMKKILKKRTRLTPVRLECKKPLSLKVQEILLAKLNLKENQVFSTSVPLDLSYTYSIKNYIDKSTVEELSYSHFEPQWPLSVDKNKSMMSQLRTKDILLHYPYESIDPFVNLLKEASTDPDVVSIKITLYRLASQSKIAESLIAAAENGINVTALFELRARFDENNNILWSQRFEDAGVNVIYGFKHYKVHSKLCCITRKTRAGIEYFTQCGTGNYNEKTCRLYTDFAYMTSRKEFGLDADVFFKNMALETVSDQYKTIIVAPLQIKQLILNKIQAQIDIAKAGGKGQVFFKTNAVTDIDIIKAIEKASNAGVKVNIISRGISCLVPGVNGHTKNLKVGSVVGRLLEHHRIYSFGCGDQAEVYLSSADLMTRNMDKRVEVAWPLLDINSKRRVLDYISLVLKDNVKLRYLKNNHTYTELGELKKEDSKDIDSQALLINETYNLTYKDQKYVLPSQDIPTSSNNGIQTSTKKTEDNGILIKLLGFVFSKFANRKE